jgi:hypothetical protein
MRPDFRSTGLRQFMYKLAGYNLSVSYAIRQK